MLAFFSFSCLCIKKLTRDSAFNEEPLSFEQYIDHDNKGAGTFPQRYYQIPANITEEVNFVILDIGGESDDFKPSGVDDFDKVLAEDLGAPVLTLEHRFFGKSLPKGDLSVESLKLLTVSQAIEDLAEFRKWYTTKHALKADTKWLIIGGSYSGLLSAFARGKYPELFDAAISSSGVVLATDDFRDFDRQIQISLGHQCSAAARTARRHIDELLEKDINFVLNLFDAAGVEKDTFRFVVGEMFSLAPQYGHREQLCGPLENTLITGEDPMMALSRFARDFFTPKFCGGSIYEAYSNKYMRNETNIDHPAARSWMWMTCNELAYWQVSSGKTTLRSPKLTRETLLDQCRDIFTPSMPAPDVAAFNKLWGGLDQKATKVFYTSGSQDPWTGLCITDEKVPKGCFAHTITGPNVGHCMDLHGAQPNDPIDLVRTRLAIREAIKMWLTE